ncbi:MAG: SDR family oxidoreductase [Rhodobacter sp.]|nr:SDR family oxidoreductase [Rhodobacter sp.]
MTVFSGKTIAITGASRGIGEAAARYFAKLGGTVVLAARSANQIETIAQDILANGGTAVACGCDVSLAVDVEALVATALNETGRLDVFVNNAGIIEPIARLADSDPTAWGQVVDVNVKGVYHGLRFAIPEMINSGGGTVINISSGAATSALEGWSHYCATKAAVLSLTRVADKEYRDRGIRVVGLSPGTVATDMQVQIRASGINPVSKLDVSDHISPEWAARAIAWLAGPGGDAHLGTDFSIKTDEGRAAVGLIETA